MPGVWGSVLVCAVLALMVTLAVRSIWKARKSGGCCGSCEKCGQCGGHCAGTDPSRKR